MITLQELCLYLEEILQTSTFSDYCKNGLQLEGTDKITKIATGVSASLATIQAAVKFGANALIVHHGLFWNSDNHVISGVKKEKLRLLLEHDISLLAYHLPLDAHKEFGNNWKAAKDMGWTDLKPFCLLNGNYIGVRGKVKESSPADFQRELENYYQHPANCALGGKSVIKSAALVSGGAYKNITDAVASQVDSYITGNFDEPVWNQAFEEKIHFFALGHAATERIGPAAIGEHLQKKFNLDYEFLDLPNPF